MDVAADLEVERRSVLTELFSRLSSGDDVAPITACITQLLQMDSRIIEQGGVRRQALADQLRVISRGRYAHKHTARTVRNSTQRASTYQSLGAVGGGTTRQSRTRMLTAPHPIGL